MSVVDLLPYLHQEPTPSTGSTNVPTDGSTNVSANRSVDAPVVALNTEAFVFEALAAAIEGTAIGWSDRDLARLEDELAVRYGDQIGGRSAVRKLVRLARTPPAA